MLSLLQVFEDGANFMIKAGSMSMRNQATWAGSISLQRNIKTFASDISVMLSALKMTLTIFDYAHKENFKKKNIKTD